MKNLLLTSVLFLTGFFAFSQGAYTSQNNKKSNWETAAIWTKQYSWMNAAPPGPADVGGSYVANIYGYITRNGNLTFSGGSTLNVYDTLVIKGNFTISSSSGVVVHPGGVLIVMGDLNSTSSGGSKLVNNGNVVVTGNFTHSGGTMTTNNKVYSFDPTPTFGWGSSVDGTNYNGSNTNGMGNQLKTQAQLNSANPSLGNFVNSIMGTLPIKLISFTAAVEQGIPALAWITAKEEGFDHFEIERAFDDLVFEKIAVQNGSGYNTEDEHHYALLDKRALKGINYYRLKSVDVDGSFEYSKVISVTVEAEKSIAVYPNSSNGDFVNISSNFALSENTQVSIFNGEGVCIKKTVIAEREARVDFTNHLTAGVYILKYTSGKFSQTVRLIVK